MNRLPAWLSPVVVVALAGCPAISPGDFAARVDLDGDGYTSDQFDGDDCRDDDAAVHPGASDAPYDDLDADCNGSSDWDADGDGYEAASHAGDDCDDADATVHPGATELCDGIDADCDGTGSAALVDESDDDGDDWLVCEGDCDDANPDIHPSAVEACNSIDDDCDGQLDADDPDVDPAEAVWYPDTDLDDYGTGTEIVTCTASEGYSHQDGDCEDDDPDIHPNADEVCDNQDNDCDATIDDDDDDVIDQATWYRDGDGDHWGTDDDAQIACFEPSGYVSAGSDCDDGSYAINPEAQEVCDTLDNDCDAAVDDDDATVSPGTPSYADADADGYGDLSLSSDLCVPPAGNVYNGEDCDDEAAAIHPGAVEVWYDGVDQDCTLTSDYDQDGDGDDATAWSGDDCDDLDPAVSSTAEELWYDGFDQNCDGADDYDQDADGFVSDVWGGDDCADTLGTANPDGAEDCGTPEDDDCDGETNPQDAIACVSFYADDDEDGYGGDGSACLCAANTAYPEATDDDCDDTNGDVSPDETEVCRDGLDNDCDGGAGDCALSDMGLGSADAKFTGVAANAGTATAGAGDVNADGYADFLVGAYFDGFDGPGRAYLVLGSGALSSGSLAGADAEFEGATVGDYAGQAVAGAGDFNNDGFDDMLVSATYANGGGTVYLLLGSSAPTSQSLDLADAQFDGESVSDLAGNALSGGADVNADGYDDMLVGAYANDEGGTATGGAYLVLGSATPASRSLATADAEFNGETGTQAGRSVALAEDLNGDGYADMLVGAWWDAEGGSFAGAAYLMFGSPTPASASLAEADAKFVGEQPDDYAGEAVCGAGDVNGDGYGDLLVGAASHNTEGAVYLLLGSSSVAARPLADADAILEGEAVNTYAGSTVAGPGDVDGDGFDDMLIGAPLRGGNDGGAFLVLGSAVPPSGSLASAAADLTPESSDDRAGFAVAGAGDSNADGYADLLIAADYDDDGGSDAGAVYLVFGNGL